MSRRKTPEETLADKHLRNCERLLRTTYETGRKDLIYHSISWQGNQLSLPDAVGQEKLRLLQPNSKGGTHWLEIITDGFGLNPENPHTVKENELAKRFAITVPALHVQRENALKTLSLSEILPEFFIP